MSGCPQGMPTPGFAQNAFGRRAVERQLATGPLGFYLRKRSGPGIAGAHP